jgi:hypothetical protein
MKSTIFWGITLCSPLNVTDVSEEYIATISGSNNNPKKKPASLALLATCFHSGFFLALFFDPQYGGDLFPETSVDFQRTTGHYIPKDSTLHEKKLIPCWESNPSSPVVQLVILCLKSLQVVPYLFVSEAPPSSK